MKAVLVEDNPSIRRLFASLLEDYAPEIDLLGIATNVSEGFDLIKQTEPELVFLDVEMPDGDGFELLSRFPSVNFQVIFITGHEKYALKAIKFSALDYLLKPIDPDELVEAIAKAKLEFENKTTANKVETLIQNVESQFKEPPKLVLKDKYGIQIISTEDIIRLEANGSYTKFFVKEREPILISRGIKEYESFLSGDLFFRCHQSHIININMLSRYDKRDGDYLYLTDGSKVPLAIRKKDALLEKIKAN